MKCEIHLILRTQDPDSKLDRTSFACLKKVVELPSAPPKGSKLKLKDLVDIGLPNPYEVQELLFMDWTDTPSVYIETSPTPIKVKAAAERLQETYRELLNRGWGRCTGSRN